MPDKQNSSLPEEHYCLACGRFSVHTVGIFKAVEIDGRLFDVDTADADALAEASERFREFALTQCDGVISHACLEEYARKEITQPTSPLSVLFASRVRGRRCGSGCGHIKKTSRLP